MNVRTSRTLAGTLAATGLLAAVACEGHRAQPSLAPDPAFAVADSLRREGRSAQALERFTALRDSFAMRGDTARLWRAQVWTADALMRLGRRDSASAALDLALVLAGDDPAREARTRHIRSVLLDRHGLFDSALVEATRALELAQAAGDQDLEGSAYNAIGRIHSLSGRYREALAANERELATRLATPGAERAVATAYNELGIDYRHLGRLDDAIAAYREALALERRAGTPLGRARVMNNLANVHVQMGELDEALRLLLDALSIVEEIGDQRALSFTLGGLGIVHLSAGNRDGARPYIVRALETNRRAGLPYGEAVNLVNLGALELGEGDFAAAARALDAALVLADSLGYGRQRAAARTGMARVALARGDSSLARRLAEEAVGIADTLGDPEAQYEAAETRGAVVEAIGGADAATVYLGGIELLESWRGRLALGDLRMGVTEPRLGVYEGAIRTLLLAGRAAEALAVAERARGRLLLELMAERERETESRLYRDELLSRLRDADEARRSVQRAEIRASYSREVDRLIAEIDSLDESRDSREALSGVRDPSPAPLAEIRAGLLVPGRALLSYFWGDSAVYGWWVTADSLRGVRLGDADSLATLVEFLRGAVESPASGADWQMPARRAHELLVRPLDQSGEEDVLVVADGPLAYVPLEVLIPADGAPPWGATHRLTYAPSASVLLALARAPRSAGWERAILAVGDPAVRSGGETSPDGERAAPLRPLPHAAEEARAVREIFRRDGADALVGRSASLERWLEMRPGRYRYLHFAAHARVSNKRPERTAIVLAGGRLGLERIRSLSLHAELVTLSACETALGLRVRGEGVIGLPHAFLAAGARGAVVTLWPVTDEPASRLMREFYGELHSGKAAGVALRDVRRAGIARGGEDAHPSRWASFILVGGLDAPGVTP